LSKPTLEGNNKDIELLVAPPVVLIVEDETLIRMNVTDELAEYGFEVIEASNAQEALLILSETDAINVMFTDVDMPGAMDGLMLADQVRDRWPLVRIIVTSGKHVVLPEHMPDDSRFFSKPYAVTAVAGAMREMTC
jgi:DNA-binding NtrC family response regulator